MNSLPAEDRTCRMCGYADQRNINLYTKDIEKKIQALYPIILYRSDPLPKNICLKCYGNVITRFEEYQRITKIQNKWITNVRNNQPDNPYIRILDKIEEVNRCVAKSLRNLSPDFYKENFQICKFNTNFPNDIILPQSVNYQKFEFNQTKCQQKEITNSKIITATKFELSLEKPKRLMGPRSFILRQICRNKCRYCLKKFVNQKKLAKHQLGHLEINLYRCFETKLLDSQLFHARTILIQNTECFRCSNCLNIFNSNSSKILQHWRNQECEFYCKLCGEEFPINPRNLFRHIESIHNVNYKTYKNLNEEILNSYKGDYYFEDEFQPESDQENSLQYEKISVMKMQRNPEQEFDIKLMNTNDESNSDDKNKSTPLLRVKNLSELQAPSTNRSTNNNVYSNFSDLKLNTLSIL